VAARRGVLRALIGRLRPRHQRQHVPVRSLTLKFSSC
jgi:hypothetical protein